MINLHGGTEPRPELYETDRLVYLETDPVQLQTELLLRPGGVLRLPRAALRVLHATPRTSATRTAGCPPRTASRSIPPASR